MTSCGCRVEQFNAEAARQAATGCLAGHEPNSSIYRQALTNGASRIVYCATHDAAFRAVGALAQILTAFSAEHLDGVSRTACGSVARAILQEVKRI